ncbi:MAG: PspC domain-containing protein [Eubacteriaceae bacterium]|nr:PspC domain-containing protein [Eubacteriaceae bacterium]
MKKKLYKDESTAKVSGVLSGIAQYFSIDVNIVRILYVLLCIFIIRPFTGIIIYFVLSYIMPDKKDIGYDDYEVR